MKKPDEWLFQPWWLRPFNWLLKWVRLRVYLAVLPGCRLRLRITRLGRPSKGENKF